MKTGHSAQNAGQSNGTSSRAPAPPTEGMSRCPIVGHNDGGQGQLSGWDRTLPAQGRGIPSSLDHQSHAKSPMTWMHVAARNLLAEHAAGVVVPQFRLDAARRLLGVWS